MADPKPRGPGVVEALQHHVTAELAGIACEEAHDAWREKLTGDGRHLTSTDELKLRLLSNLGKQIVTATAVPAGGAS